jgi:preprotein translocase subunit SecA
VLFSAINEEFAPLYLGKDELPEHLQQAARHFASRPAPASAADTRDVPAETRPRPAGDGRGVPAGRNAPCACGSGKRYKHCCGRFD